MRDSTASRRQGKDIPLMFTKGTRRHVQYSLHTMLLALYYALLLFPSTLAASSCMRFADYSQINQVFIDGGPGTRVVLCPSKTYRLTGPIVFTAADQEIATLGYPTGSERATLVVHGDFATAIQGDCRRCARISISSLIIDGRRSKLGRMIDQADSTGLIVIGGNEGQMIKQCSIRDPRGFTAIHVREGDKLQCKSATIEQNEIGPVGEEYRPEVDGPDPEMSPLGRPLADGISIACKDSFVRDNTFFDNTDAAIVIYGSPGTLVHANTIMTRKMSAMAGMLMVDSTPFDGDYTGMTVKANIIDAAAKIIRVGIGIGPSVWSDDTETVLKGGTVIANGIRGKYMGYGIAAAGLDGWTIKGNWDEAKHSGVRSARCFEESNNPEPMAFLQDGKLNKKSDIQPGFVDHPFEYIVCIDAPGPAEKGNVITHLQPEEAVQARIPEDTEAKTPTEAADPVEPAAPVAAEKLAHPVDNVDLAGRAKPAKDVKPVVGPASVPAAEDELERFSTGSEIMDDILEHSQLRMLEAIDVLARRVDILADAAKSNEDVTHQGKMVMSPQVATALDDLESRIAGIEYKQQSMLDIAVSLRSVMRSWDVEMAHMSEWQYEVLLDVQHRLNLHNKPSSLSPPPDAVHLDHDHDHEEALERARKQSSSLLSNRARMMGNITAIHDSSWTQPIRFIIAQAVFLAVVMLGRTCWKGRKPHRKAL